MEVHKMNKKIILVMLIIFGVVAVSGCIGSEDTSNNNEIPIVDNFFSDKGSDDNSNNNQPSEEPEPNEEPKPPSGE